MKSAENIFGGRRSFSFGRTHRPMMKLGVALRNRFAKASKMEHVFYVQYDALLCLMLFRTPNK